MSSEQAIIYPEAGRHPGQVPGPSQDTHYLFYELVWVRKVPKEQQLTNFDGKYALKCANPRPPRERDHLGWSELAVKMLASAMSCVCGSDTTGDPNEAVLQ